MSKEHWLVKQEPEAYSWDQFVREGGTMWDGVRNYQARNNLRAMNQGDLVCFYHSVKQKQVVGVAKVTKEAYPDPTADEGDWSVVDLMPLKTLNQPVSLHQMKQDPILRQIPLIKQSRLSVSPLSAREFRRILELSGTRL